MSPMEDVNKGIDQPKAKEKRKRGWIDRLVMIALIFVGVLKVLSIIVANQTESYLNNLQGDVRLTNVSVDSDIWDVDVTFDGYYVTSTGEQIDEMSFRGDVELKTLRLLAAPIAYFKNDSELSTLVLLHGDGKLTDYYGEAFQLKTWIYADRKVHTRFNRGRFFLADDSRSVVTGDEEAKASVTIHPDNEIELVYQSKDSLIVAEQGVVRMKSFDYRYRSNSLSRLTIDGLELEPGYKLMAQLKESTSIETDEDDLKVTSNFSLEGITLDDFFSISRLFQLLENAAEDDFRKNEIEVEMQNYLKKLVKKESGLKADLTLQLGEEQAKYKFDLMFSAEDELSSYKQLTQWLKGNIYSTGNLSAVENWGAMNTVMGEMIEESSGINVEYSSELALE